MVVARLQLIDQARPAEDLDPSHDDVVQKKFTKPHIQTKRICDVRERQRLLRENEGEEDGHRSPSCERVIDVKSLNGSGTTESSADSP